ncbi:MAG: Ni/Fe hydrogenase subunit alpha [Candidatus Nitrospinota bacterium M3_3B_026]
MSETRKIRVDYLARVEGEGAMTLKIKDGAVSGVALEIFEPPRFFEAFLRGRRFQEAPDITARICGICPIAYQMSAVHAMEDALGVAVDGATRDLRRLIYCGEWIESHALHVYMLHAPDFLGYESAIHMAKDHPEIVKRGLFIKKAGNAIVSLLGGREVHPINVRVGGFYRLPRAGELSGLEETLKRARDEAVETVKWAAALPFPEFERDYVFVALSHEREYPFNEGRITSTGGLDIPVSDYEKHFEEEHAAHSTALRSKIKGGGAYMTGPMARYSINFGKLRPIAVETARAAGLAPYITNPYKSIAVRAVEILHAIDEALRIIGDGKLPEKPFVEAEPSESTGYGATEAPRGLLYHRYTLDESGLITSARIVPPTSQNQRIIEEDLFKAASENLRLPDDELTLRLEQTIRNYDPCISCSTHFLKLKIEHER